LMIPAMSRYGTANVQLFCALKCDHAHPGQADA
jgi:hypothetical protein